MKGELGKGRIGVFIWIVLMVALFFVAFRTIPLRVSVLKLHDYCEEQARYAAASNRYSEQDLRKEILARASDLNVPLTAKNLSFERRNNIVIVGVKHEVAVNLEFYEWIWKYDRKFEHVRY